MAVWGVAAQGQTPDAGATQQPQPGQSQPSERPAQPSPSPSQPSQPAPAPERGAAAEEITIAGCLARADAAFRLTDAKGAGASASAKVEDEYSLVAGSGVSLAPHVDHQVEVTGRASAAAGGAPSITVSAVKMIADKCE
jgi:hypothetical protein